MGAWQSLLPDRTQKRRQSVKLQLYKEFLNTHNTKTIKCISTASALQHFSLAQPCQHLPHSLLCHPRWHRKMDTAFYPGQGNALSLPHTWGGTPSSLQQTARIKALNMHKPAEEGIVLGYRVTLQKMEVGKKVLTTHHCCLLHDTWSLQGTGLNSSFSWSLQF